MSQRADLTDRVIGHRSWDERGRRGPVEPPAGPAARLHATAVASAAVQTAAQCDRRTTVEFLHAIALDGGWVALRTLRGLDWLIESGVDVLLLPFGLRPASPIFNPLLRRARDRDIVVVAPIGNGGSGSGVSPGRSDLVISVGALDERGAPARYSGSDVAPDGRCRFPHVLAPGQIDFVEAAGAEHTLEGTSFAAARVAGLAAGLRAAAPEWSASAVRSAIEHTATPITGPARSRFGAIEMGGALRSARESTTDPAPSPFPLEETSFRDPRLASLAKWSVDEIPALVRCANVTGPTALDATIAALTAAGIAHSRAESADTAGTVLTHIAARHVRRVLELDSLELVQCVDVSPFRH